MQNVTNIQKSTMTAGDALVCCCCAGLVLLFAAVGMYVNWATANHQNKIIIEHSACVGAVRYYAYAWTSAGEAGACTADNCTAAPPAYGGSFDTTLLATVTATAALDASYCSGVAVGATATFAGRGVGAESVARTMRLAAQGAQGEYYLHRTRGGLVTTRYYAADAPAVNNTLAPQAPPQTPAMLRAEWQNTRIVAFTGFAAIGFFVAAAFVIGRVRAHRHQARLRLALYRVHRSRQLPMDAQTVFVPGRGWTAQIAAV